MFRLFGSPRKTAHVPSAGNRPGWPPASSDFVDGRPFATAGVEPTLNDLLNEPVLRLLMRRNGVSTRDLRRLAEDFRAKRRPMPTPGPPPLSRIRGR